MTCPDVSDRTSTSLAAAVSPRNVTALSIISAVLSTTITEITFSPFATLEVVSSVLLLSSGPSLRSSANSSIFLPLEKS